MDIKELEGVRKALDTVIENAKASKTMQQVIEIEKTAFTKYQIYIAGSISILKSKVY